MRTSRSRRHRWPPSEAELGASGATALRVASARPGACSLTLVGAYRTVYVLATRRRSTAAIERCGPQGRSVVLIWRAFTAVPKRLSTILVSALLKLGALRRGWPPMGNDAHGVPSRCGATPSGYRSPAANGCTFAQRTLES